MAGRRSVAAAHRSSPSHRSGPFRTRARRDTGRGHPAGDSENDLKPERPPRAPDSPRADRRRRRPRLSFSESLQAGPAPAAPARRGDARFPDPQPRAAQRSVAGRSRLGHGPPPLPDAASGRRRNTRTHTHFPALPRRRRPAVRLPRSDHLFLTSIAQTRLVQGDRPSEWSKSALHTSGQNADTAFAAKARAPR